MKQSSHRQPSCLHKNGSRKKLMERILQKNTEAQKGTEEEKRILLNAIPQQAFMIDTQETIVAANESLARSLGKSINEIIDSSVCDLFPPDVVERLRRRVDESIHTGKPVHFKDMWQGRYCAYDVQPVFDTEGKVARVAISVTDITECKRAEEALQESERRHRLLTEISSDVIYTLDTNARITYVSPSITGLLGYTVDEMLSLSMEEYLAPVSLEVALKTFREDQTMESLGNGKRPRTRQLVMELRRKDGTAVWTETTLTFLRNPDGHITGYLGIVRDISERKQVEEALQESEAEYRLLVENSNEAITVACDGIICFANSKTTEISGYSREELISKAFVDFIHPDDREMVAERHVRRVTGEQFPGVYSFRFVDKSGNVKWLEANAVLISWEGRPASLNFSTDITERKQALDELKASYEQLRNLYRRLQSVREEERISIAREVHDELGQALVGLKMDISWLGTKLRPTNETLLDKTRAMSEAIDNTIKAVKRISTTLRPAVLDDLGLVAAVQWQVTEFQSKTGIKCKLDLGRHRELATDAELNTGIFRILQEALTNIVRHANATKVKVSLLQKDGELLLKLSDNGRGIEKDQISSPESFGLIGIRERASALGGEAKIIGIPGRGTVLTVAVPMIRGMKSHDKNIGG